MTGRSPIQQPRTEFSPPRLYTDQFGTFARRSSSPRASRPVRWVAVFWLAYLGAWALVPLVWWLLR